MGDVLGGRFPLAGGIAAPWSREQRLWWLLWARCPGLGWVRLQALDQGCGGLALAWRAPATGLASLPGWHAGLVPAVERFRSHWGEDPLAQLAQLEPRLGLGVVLPGDRRWPLAIGALERPPLALWWQGRGALWSLLAGRRAVAVVGTVVAVVAVGTVVAVVVVVVTVGAVVVAGALRLYELVPTLRVPYARPVQLPTVHCPPTHLSLRCAAGAACLLELQLLVVHWCLREWSWGRGLALLGLLLCTFSFFPSAVCACSRVQLKCCLCRVFVYTLARGSFGVFFSPHALAGSERSVCG